MYRIAGYAGARDGKALPPESLEYRGYDSAGLVLYTNGKIHVLKTTGRVSNPEDKILNGFRTTPGTGYTRWATHGKLSDSSHVE